MIVTGIAKETEIEIGAIGTEIGGIIVTETGIETEIAIEIEIAIARGIENPDGEMTIVNVKEVETETGNTVVTEIMKRMAEIGELVLSFISN